MKNKISVIGGDLRILELIKILSQDNFEIFSYGFEKCEDIIDLANVKKCHSLKDALQESNVILTAIPLSIDGENINAIYSDTQIKIDDLLNNISDKMLISGRLDDRFTNNKNIKCYDILKNEEYTILNAIATAEGAIQVAMEEFPKTLSGSNILIMGFGRIGKILSKMLQGIGANVYCEARKKEDLAYIKAYGYTPVPLEELEENLQKYDIIINNIPVMILDKKRLDMLKKDVLIIDLASKPGGVDFEYAKEKNIKTNWALALPGKVAPVSCAEYIKQVLYNILDNTKERKKV